MRVLATAVVLMVSVLSGTVHAQLIVASSQGLKSCLSSRLYTAKSADAPPAVASSFAGPGAQLAFRLCPDLEGNTHYFLREPEPAEAGICRMREVEVFPGGSNDEFPIDSAKGVGFNTISGWKAVPPPEWLARYYMVDDEAKFAMLADQPCPPGDDKAYIPVDHVTDGTLRSISHLWDKVIRSPRDFDKAFAHVDARSNAGGPINPKYIAGLKGQIFQAQGEPLRLYQMDCAGNNSNECEAFVGNHQHSYKIGFDVGDSGLVLTRLLALEAVI